MARIRTLEFLPEIFQTSTNAQFLAATLDQLVSEPTTMRIQGFVGSRMGHGVNALDYYVTEPTKTRVDYQLDPSVVFTKPNESIAQDFITYPGIIDSLKMQGALTDNNNNLFQSQIYSWDSFTNLDKLVNYNEYYWLPDGPPAVAVSPENIYSVSEYVVTDYANAYGINERGATLSSPANPTLTLIRGGTYTFDVDQSTQFWIQTAPGTSGHSPTQPNLPTREVYGVSNNGALTGQVTFEVPNSNAQSEYDFPGNNIVDVVSTTPFAEINGQVLRTFTDPETGVTYQGVSEIDGINITSGMRVLFYNTGVPNETGYVSSYFGETNYDVNDPYLTDPKTVTIASTNASDYLTIAAGHSTAELTINQTITFEGPTLGGVVVGQVYFVSAILNSTDFRISNSIGGSVIDLSSDTGAMIANINQGQYQQGFNTVVNQNFYTVQLVGDPTNPTIRLLPDGEIPVNQKITPTFGTLWINRPFYRNVYEEINLIPIITANLNVLYYQDGTNPNKVGTIRLVDANADNFINVTTQILGKKTYTSSTGVKFTNGMKVIFEGNVYPTSYQNNQYYVEGVGTAINLVPVLSLQCPEKFTIGEYIPWDTLEYDEGSYDINLNIPVEPDYITIARDAINKNAWSRSNRWFHSDVITAAATYNNNPAILTTYATLANKAKRPIIEFYPDLKLFNSGSVGKKAVDFFDTHTTDALSTVAGLYNYYPDVQTSTINTATITGTITSTTTTTIIVPNIDITGTFQVGMYVADYFNVLPINTQVQEIVTDSINTTLTVSWEVPQIINTTANSNIIGTATTVQNYAVFPGARIVFANDADLSVRNKIYVVDFASVSTSPQPELVLSLAEDASPLPDEMLAINRGYNYKGFSFYYNGTVWTEAQKKITVNQAPLFDVFDKNGISFGDQSVYTSTSFRGNKLFSYQLGTGIDDAILGFPISYSSINNIGDIQFDISLNSATFDYVSGSDSITLNVNTGYVHDYTSAYNYDRMIGWQTTVSPSTQYQAFSFDFDPLAPIGIFTCDVPATADIPYGEVGWSNIQVFINNEYQDPTAYTTTVTANTTSVVLNTLPLIKTVVQILILSDQVSTSAYYTIPVNLSNNPLNEDIVTANLGDIRMQYADMFINAPNTSGDIFGLNNFRDCGDLVPYGTKIIQNSASLVIPGAFLRKQDNSLIDALLFNSREYVKYKQLLVDTVQNTEYSQRYTPSYILDMAIEQIAASRSEINAFFWSDMLPSKSPYRSNSYIFNSDLDITRYPLTQSYNFETANYNGVLVYITRTIDGVTSQTQLLRNVDYTIDMESPTVTVIIPLHPGDIVTVNEYNQTYGSYVPNTPSKLGLYRLYQPSVVLDSNYSQPTYFIKGHDGSYTKLYGRYIPESDVLVDFRDQALLEFEKRIYNNCKLSTEVPIQIYDVVPGFFRTSNDTWEQWIEMYSTSFLNWIGQNRIDYKTQYFQRNNEWTFNYTNSANKLNNTPIQQGYWRGLYEFMYDTTTPNTSPWEMLGFTEMPSWWTSRYGPAPYTSDNDILWNDLEAGFVWNNGESFVVSELARPGLSKIIPVDSNGDLLSPLYTVVGNYNPSTFQKDWKVGDDGPVELSYRRSSSYPYDVIRLFALTRPAELYNLGVDLDNYKYNAEFNQYLVNDRSHLVPSNIEVYGNGTAKTSYINWIVDFQKQQGVDSTSAITSLLDNLDVRLAYRLAGFSDKTLLNFYVEKSSPNASNAALLIPDESYTIQLYDNQPFDRLTFSGVTIQQNEGSWTVFGNSQNFAYFTVLKPNNNTPLESITVGKITVKVAKNYSTSEVLIPYGTVFHSAQELAQFLMSYAEYLKSKGMQFVKIEEGTEINWALMVQEFLYWIQTGWEIGSIITVNPAATDLYIDKDGSIVQPLTVHNQNFVLNQDLYPIQLSDLCVNRDETAFHIHTLNEGDALSYAQFNMSNIEHGIVFDNVTLFNDTIYNLVTGLRQNRINVRGTKTAEWNGTINAWGFILNQDNVQEWSNAVKYPKGVIVKYKNKYWTALDTVEPSATFNNQLWKIVDYQNIQKGMLSNAASRAYESTLYYNVDKANLEQDADLLSFSLIGYRPRDYLALADLTDITQINVYKNLIKNKGTRNATYAFKGANLPQGGIDYNVYENWAIKTGEYGGVLNDNFVEFRLNQNTMTGDPAIVSLTSGQPTEGSMQEVSLNNLYNYGRPVTDPNVLSTTDNTTSDILYPTAGYANFNDVRMSSFYYAGLPNAVNSSGIINPIGDFYVRDYMWLANYKERWGIYSWSPIGEIVQVRSNVNNTTTVTFAEPHGLKQLDSLSIVNFAPNVDGYYIISDVINLNEVIINLPIINATPSSVIQGRGIGMALNSQRVERPSDISNLNLLESEFTKNTVWVDENKDGSWAVYRKSLNYQFNESLTTPSGTSFGSAVAYSSAFGYLVSDAGAGKVHRYNYDATLNLFNQTQVLSPAPSSTSTYGTAIAHAGNIFAVSQPNTAVYVYVQNESVVASDIIAYQTITPPTGVTLDAWGSAIAFSSDSNWLYISGYRQDTDPSPIVDNGLANVYVYRKQQFEVSSGYFTIGQTYTISDVLDTDFVAVGAIDNAVGITFVATGVGSGSGTATQVTYTLAAIIDDISYSSDDLFGHAISTNRDGSIVVIGVPGKDHDALVTNWGNTVVYQRSVQNFEATTNSISGQPQLFDLTWTPSNLSKTVSATDASGNLITLNNTSGISINDPIVFYGTNLLDTNVGEYVTYYVRSIEPSNKITIKESRSSTTPVNILTKSLSDVNASVQTDLIYVSVNGTMVADSGYSVIENKFVFTNTLTAGDIINVSDAYFTKTQTFNSQYADRVNIQFGYALDITNSGSEILIGSPYEINSENQEGHVYRFTNAGAKFGVVIGTSECFVSSSSVFLINGFAVNISAGSYAQDVAYVINTAGIPNIEASATADNKLIIQVINSSVADINKKLEISATDSTILSSLGLSVYSLTQVISCPHASGPTQFGKAIKFNEYDSVVISAPVGTRYSGTEFDFTDDENTHNDTVFDNNSTRFVDESVNAGAVYMFDLMSNYNGSVNNPGLYVYAQSVNSADVVVEGSPMYGSAIDFNENVVMAGAPNYIPVIEGGQATVYFNDTGIRDWTEYRQSSAIVDINKIQNTQLFNAITNDTIINLDYMDPIQGKLLGAVRENIDYVAKIDPARYNSDFSPLTGTTWGADHVGEIWFNTDAVRFVNYHQDDVVYNSKYWGTLFTGSDVAVYTWIASNTPPGSYQGPGVPYDINLYTVGSTLNASDVVSPVYYFWVRNSNIIDQYRNKTLADSVIAEYISNPKNSGIAYVAPLLPNTFAIYNSGEYFYGTDTVFHIGFANGTTDDVVHSEFVLIREDFSDDFLPGLPVISDNSHILAQHGLFPSAGTMEPTSLYARMIDSLSGCNIAGGIVPDPYLPPAVQSGIAVRPRQSFFYNRFGALKNYIQYANEIILQYPIIELKPDLSFLFSSNEFYDTTNYWEYVNWWATGYNDSVRSSFQVPSFADLIELSVAIGTIVKVEQNGAGLYEVYRYDGAGVWTRIGLQNGTLQFSDLLWNYDLAKTGFGGDFFDTVAFDSYPSQETRQIIRALNEQIYTGDLASYRNKSLILLFEYIQSETTESQNFLPWLSKTSLADVSHTIRELKPYEVFKSDNEAFLEGYINEVKPYHVVVKEFLFNYTGSEEFTGDITDFDLPATWNNSYQQFISPQLVNDYSVNQYEYLPTANIWSTAPYSQWFDNRGLSLTGQSDVVLTRLSSYITAGDTFIMVDNASGFPVNGTVRIDNELISYSYVDRAFGILSGVTRGVDRTQITDHLPGAEITMDLPAVIVLDGGRGYIDPPKVIAYIDETLYPAPTVPAQLEAIMAQDSVIGVTVVDPGQGYMVLPEIVIDSAYKLTFADSDINSTLHTINLSAPYLKSGDQVRFVSGSNGISPTKLVNGEWYYIGILDTIPTVIAALYTSYADAIKDQDRVLFTANGTSDDMALLTGARATTITSSAPVRENNITLKFDRTSYTSQVMDWVEGAYYGAYFAGTYYNPDRVSSSSYTLNNTQPNIATIFASAQGAVFEITEVANDEVTNWSSYTRYIANTVGATNSIKLVPQDNNNPDLSDLKPNASGTTIGMTKNMPVKFAGQVVGGLQENTVYYIAEVINETEFSVSTEINGTVVSLTDATPITNLLRCYTEDSIATTIVTVNYPGILTVTATSANYDSYNYITVPLSEIGTGGTTNFYTGLPLFFTGAVFGGLIENRLYYVVSVIDSQTFTMSESSTTPVTVTVTNTTNSNIVTVNSTAEFSVNDPIIFTGTTFGNIIAGKTYYVKEVISGTEMTISESVNGQEVVLVTDSGSATVTNQIDTVKVSNETGAMTMNVSLPVSPGQVNGQLFTFYQTSGQYPSIVPTDFTNLIQTTISATISGVNRVVLPVDTNMSSFYINMPVRVDSSIGGLNAATTYYVTEYSGRPLETIPPTFVPVIRITASNTSSVGNLITCDTTESLYVNMPIIFSGEGLGGISIGQEYYIKTIDSLTTFTITDTIGESALVLTTANGTMPGTGSPYITVSTSMGGSAVALTDDNSGIPTLTQFITAIPMFDISSILGGYRALITDPGSGFAIGNFIFVPGTSIGGSSPANDLTMTVNTIGDNGEITDVVCEGIVPTLSQQYYLKVRSPNTFAVYSNSGLTVPVSFGEFPYVGFTSTDVASVSSVGNKIIVSDTTGFNVNDDVIFTGEVVGNLNVGQTYFIISIDSMTNEITVSETPAGIAFDPGNASGKFTMAKAGSIAFLPEPFFFNQSIVRFNNRLYVCVVSNNDTDFVLGKWEQIRSDYPTLNALDRVKGFYSPTVNMPGLDLSQLFDGVSYPNPIVRGNAFQPDQQFPIDTVITDSPFYPSGVNTESLIWNNSSYIAVANLSNYSAVVVSADGNTWGIGKLTNFNISVSDIIYAGGYYLITSNNVGTPIFRSVDGIEWSTTGYYVPYGTTVEYGIPVSNTPIITAGLSLNASVYHNNYWIAVGKNIIRSTDSYTWNEVSNFNTSYDFILSDVCVSGLAAFSGLVTVGKGLRIEYSAGYAQLVDTNVILYSTDGQTWNEVNSLTNNGLNSVSSSNGVMIAVGDAGVIYSSYNGADWVGVNEVGCVSIAVSNKLNVTSTSGFSVNDPVRFNNSFSAITAGITYYIESIISDTQITLSTTEGGSIIALADSQIPTQTLMKLVNANEHALNDVIYTNGTWITVGDSGTIKTSSNGINWTTRSSGTTEDLNSITHSSSGKFVAAGTNNCVITSVDNGVTWYSTSMFEVAPPLYTVKGTDFLYGYGPEELIPGNITDNLALTVITRPGTNWPVVEYGHTGYNTKSIEITPDQQYQTVFSFKNVVETPAQLCVQVIDGTTGLGTTLYPMSYDSLGATVINYTVDWVKKEINLSVPLTYYPTKDKLRIDVYEAGNGDQLVKSNTDTDPIRVNPSSLFTEIYVSCNYSQDIQQGSGVIRTGATNVSTIATATNSATNKITCADVTAFVLNEIIIFGGTTFGGISEGETYYIKTIDYATTSITVSLTRDAVSGIAGSTVTLTTGTGTMTIDTNRSSTPWSSPIMYHNGSKLILGVTGFVTNTNAGTNTVVTSNTAGMSPGDPIVFCDCVFGDVIEPFVTYYVLTVDNNEFTLSTSPGGSVLPLTDASGGSRFITYDYVFGIQPDGVSAKITFANQAYTNAQDYIVYSLFGETTPDQYGYTIPEFQYFKGDGATSVFGLTNFIGGTNPENAVVEIDEIRQAKTDYSINSSTNQITFSVIPDANTTISVMSFNDTRRQYLVNQDNLSGIVAPISNINNTISAPITGTINATTTGSNAITVNSSGGTAGFFANQTVLFKGTAFGGITAGTVYFVRGLAAVNFSASVNYTITYLGTTNWNAIGYVGTPVVGGTFTASGSGSGTGEAISSTKFRIADSAGSIITLSTATGDMDFEVGGNPAVRITTSIPHGLIDNNIVRIDDVVGSYQLNNNTYYVKIITPTVFDIYSSPYTAARYGTNYPVTEVSTYVSGGFTWLVGSFFLATTTATATTGISNLITVDSVSDLVVGTPVYFSAVDHVDGDNILGGLIQNTKYYIKDIFTSTTITVSSVRYGDEVVLSSDTGTINVTQWEQVSVDRLWVTINGKRVPSSKLRINPVNEVSILAEITSSDNVVITNMIPTATPNEEIYMNLVDKNGMPTVFNSNANTRTWTNQPLYYLSSEIHLNDVSRITNTVTQTSVTPALSDGFYYVGLNADKRILSSVTIMNNGTLIDPVNYELVLVSIAPQVKITPGEWINTGDILTITFTEGNTIFINGEQILFDTIDFTNNTLSGLSRGVNGTAIQPIIPTYSVVYGMLPENILPSVYYDQTWNSEVYNTTEGDPLQISQTSPAIFLNTDIN